MTHPNPSPTHPEDDPTNPSHPSYIGDGWWVGSAGGVDETNPSHIDEPAHQFAAAILDAVLVGITPAEIKAAIRLAGEVEQ